ncbi:hypothetical protein DICPUDRAFT_99360 [Dictyostelium purpureum]|uniref:RING-type domain-containing protein n=1 Tax=Dictyostelium purpureum TaxID=5786 RepID=F0ZYG9_DICPU|nr:uncharacterized protein DICPUDRAFT_99360 [Dictyostelium purpureum]EGC31025.1 hypothetical protein DICPUDRAFT_99360 [Dictyostelium purpureum]|eukprot:XP_003292463.1 hypothetical protein DICPUDRAFT_99360 [Dictyostelium purpureum]
MDDKSRFSLKATRLTFSSGAKVGGGVYSIEARWGHASVSIGKKIYLFGGQGQSLYSNTVVYDSTTSIWSEVNTLDKGPSGRYGHSATLVEDQNDPTNLKIIVFGGKTSKKYVNDLFSLDLKTMSWSTFHFSKNVPDTRAGHTCTFVPGKNGQDSRIILFGGNHQSKYLNSLFILEIPRLQTGTIKWIKPPTKGTSPSHRSAHTADFIKDKNIILYFGGFDGKRSFNDLHALNVNDLSWSKVITKGIPPSPRNGHSSVLVNGRYLVIHGGCFETAILNDVHILDVSTFTWFPTTVVDLVLFNRFQHSSNLLDSGEMITFGGCSSGLLYSDMFNLDLRPLLPQQIVSAPPTANTTTTTSTTTNANTPNPTQKEITYSVPNYTLELSSQNTTPIPLSPMNTSTIPNTTTTTTTTTATNHNNNINSDCCKCTNHPTNLSTDHLSTQLNNALSLLNLEQNQKSNLSNELMKTKLDRAEAIRSALEEQSKIENLEKELSKIDAAYKKELSQKTKFQDSLNKITSALKEKENILQSYNEILTQIKCNIKDTAFLEKKDTVIQILAQFSNLSNINDLQSLKLTKENIVNKTLEIRVEDLEKETLELKKQLEQQRVRNLELNKAKEILFNQVKRDTVSLEHMLGNSLVDLSLQDLDKLEEFYHNSLKKIGIAKQEVLQRQLDKLQKEKDENSNNNTKNCIVCVDLSINTVLLPCKHSCICNVCAKKLSLCPLCRSEIKDIIEYY